MADPDVQDEAEDSTSSDSDWVITINGFGFQHGLPDREEFQRMAIRGTPSSKMFSTWLSQTHKNAADIPEESRPPIELTEAEKAPVHQGKDTAEVLLVGLFLPSPNVDIKKIAPGIGQGKAVGGPDNLNDISGRTKALRVVAPIASGSVMLFALVNPQGGLCEAFKIATHECFYFSEYRDLSSSKTQRQTAWNQKIKEQIAGLDTGTSTEKLMALFLKRARHHNVAEDPKVVGSEAQRYANQLLYQVNMFKAKRDKRHLTALTELLQIDEEKVEFHTGNSLLHRLLDEEASFGEDECDMLANMKELWPKQKVQSRHLLAIRACLKEYEETIELRLAKPLIKLLSNQIERFPEAWEADRMGTFTRSVALVEDMCPPSSRAPIPPGSFHKLIDVVRQKLQDISGNLRDRSNALAEYTGDTVSPSDVPALLHEMTTAVDVGQVKLGYALLARSGMDQLAKTNQDIAAALNRIIEDLESLNSEEADE